jgi:hypothetical protein
MVVTSRHSFLMSDQAGIAECRHPRVREIGESNSRAEGLDANSCGQKVIVSMGSAQVVAFLPDRMALFPPSRPPQYYTRIDAPATPGQKVRLPKLSHAAVQESKLAGELITTKLTSALVNGASAGRLMIVTRNG